MQYVVTYTAKETTQSSAPPVSFSVFYFTFWANSPLSHYQIMTLCNLASNVASLHQKSKQVNLPNLKVVITCRPKRAHRATKESRGGFVMKFVFIYGNPTVSFVFLLNDRTEPVIGGVVMHILMLALCHLFSEDRLTQSVSFFVL